MLYARPPDVDRYFRELFDNESDEFFLKYFEKHSKVYLDNDDSLLRNKLINLVGSMTLEELIDISLSCKSSICRIVLNGDEYQPNQRASESEVRQDILNKYKEGWTVVLQNIGQCLPTIKHIQNTIEQIFPANTNINLYFTPAHTEQGFKAHFDTHDVLALQVHGSKVWKYENTSRLTVRKKRFSNECESDERSYLKHKLIKGEMLYIPRGFWHYATPTDDSSLHITIGIVTTRLTDVLKEFIDLGGEIQPLLQRSITWNDFNAKGLNNDVHELNIEKLFNDIYVLLELFKNNTLFIEATYRALGASIVSRDFYYTEKGHSTRDKRSSIILDCEEYLRFIIEGTGFSDDRLGDPAEYIVGKKNDINSLRSSEIEKLLPNVLSILRDINQT